MKPIHKPPLWLLTMLIMFPQLVETIYSPALPHIAHTFGVSSERASQTLSIYFIAFAMGVAAWGYLSDLIGRRPAMILGLLFYGAGTIIAIFTTDFYILLFARIVSAFGAAAGSILVQTILRDSYESVMLARVFSIMGVALALSPVFGLLSGGWLVSVWGYIGVFTLLSFLALLLLILTVFFLVETRPSKLTKIPIRHLAIIMIRDNSLWKNAILIALFNTMLFSYYSLAPFLFDKLLWGPQAFGWTGLLLASASLVANLFNRKLLSYSINSEKIVQYAINLTIIAGVIAWMLQNSALILIPILGIVIAYGMAIPNILSQALQKYREQAGSAGALFGLTYYLLLGLMLGMVSMIQQLGLVLTICAIAALLCNLSFKYTPVK